MHELMVACQELRKEDAEASKSTDIEVAPPTAPAPAVAEGEEEQAELMERAMPDEETFAAMRWASRLPNDSAVLGLIRSLPNVIVEEQLRLYRQRPQETAVAEEKIRMSPSLRWRERMLVAQRFDTYCQRNGIGATDRMPRGTLRTFVEDHIDCSARNETFPRHHVRKWHRAWLRVSSRGAIQQGHTQKRSRLKSRAHQAPCRRVRARGAGRPCKAPLIRQELYEWWSSMRYAIDWKELIAARRSRGKKQNLARFPRAILVIKVTELLESHAYASLLNGGRLQSFNPDSRWFAGWEEEYGLSMRLANRKYQVPRPVLKERLEIFWANLFRLRLLIQHVFGYDPVILNFDQSPFHHNESGAQNKRTLSLRGCTVPIVEGNTDTKSRWTANLSTCSKFAAVAGANMPFCEMLFKGATDGIINTRLQEFLRRRQFPSWFSVAVAPKGSYRELDVIDFLKKHLEEWRGDRDWRILLADDFAAHKTRNVFNLAWSRGYVILIHGGGATPVAQTPDTDLNQHVRREYGMREARMLVDKMRGGEVVPKLSNEQCMELMLEVLSDPGLHVRAAQGYKKTGQSIDLHGQEDCLICREAAVFWNEETTDGQVNMRCRVDNELATVAEEIRSGRLTWCQSDVQRLLTPYPSHKEVDRVLQALGEDFYHDELQDLETEEQEAPDASSDESDAPGAPTGLAAVAGDCDTKAAFEDDGDANAVDACAEPARVEDQTSLSAAQADAVHRSQASTSALELAMEGLRSAGQLQAAHAVELALRAEKRRTRALAAESPAIAEAFLQRRKVEEQDAVVKRRRVAKQNEREREAAKAIADRNAAVAELKKAKRSLQELESLRVSQHALNTFTLDVLGQGSHNAGGAKARTRRFEVLDRLARMNAGLSPAQKNDWHWFKEAWDEAMVAEHREGWAELFSAWMQGVLEDARRNAFSLFVHDETRRVFHGLAALHVPGS